MKFPYIPQEMIYEIFSYLPREYGIIILGDRQSFGSMNVVIHKDHVYYISETRDSPSWQSYEMYTVIKSPVRLYMSRYGMFDEIGNMYNFTTDGFDFWQWKRIVDEDFLTRSTEFRHRHGKHIPKTLPQNKGVEIFKEMSVGGTRYYRTIEDKEYMKIDAEKQERTEKIKKRNVMEWIGQPSEINSKCYIHHSPKNTPKDNRKNRRYYHRRQ